MPEHEILTLTRAAAPELERDRYRADCTCGSQLTGRTWAMAYLHWRRHQMYARPRPQRPVVPDYDSRPDES